MAPIFFDPHVCELPYTAELILWAALEAGELVREGRLGPGAVVDSAVTRTSPHSTARDYFGGGFLDRLRQGIRC